MAEIISGKVIAGIIKEEVKLDVERLKAKGIHPKLCVVLVGGDPASQIYVNNKEKACAETGLLSEIFRLPAEASQEEIIELISKLNEDKGVHGILLQLPIPKGLDEKKILDRISPKKDVDGLHTENMGRLLKGEKGAFVPCTPNGVMRMLLSTGISVEGKEAVVIGRSNIVGKPMALLLLNANATVTMCHSKTKDLPSIVKRGDIVVAAIGKSKFVKGDWIKEGAVVVDVGMNRTPEGLFGDVDFESAKEKASYITPVPGGVGLMTVAMLLKNTIASAEESLKDR